MKALKKLFGGCSSKDDATEPAKVSPRPVGGAAAGGGVGHPATPSSYPAASPPASSVPVAAVCEPCSTPSVCSNACGWTAFPGFANCCRNCKGPDGPHAKDCEIKNTRPPPLCFCGCGRPAFGSFATCCTKCEGPEGPHTRDCAAKNRSATGSGPGAGADVRGSSKESVGGVPAAAAPALTPEEVNEELRLRLVEWQTVGAMKTRDQVDEVIQSLAAVSGMEQEAVRMLWMTIARQARPVGAPTEAYIALAKKHHCVEVEVIDLGAGSANHTNSCMFLTCAAELADRRAKGYTDAMGCLGDALDEAAPASNSVASIDELIEQHRQSRSGTLGRMADALRHAACEVLQHDVDFFWPYFHPVSRGRKEFTEAESKQAYFEWVAKLRGDEEGDELVILALARLIGLAVQPVQQSGYRVPLMDPTESAETDAISYWGNDDRHWVWLRPLQEEVPRLPAAAPAAVQPPVVPERSLDQPVKAKSSANWSTKR